MIKIYFLKNNIHYTYYTLNILCTSMSKTMILGTGKIPGPRLVNGYMGKDNEVCCISICILYIPIDLHDINNIYIIKTNKLWSHQKREPELYMKMSINLYMCKNL